MDQEIEVTKDSVLNVLLDVINRLNDNGELVFEGQTVKTSILDYKLTQIKNPSITNVEEKCAIGETVCFTGGGEFVFENENKDQLTSSDYYFNGDATIIMKEDKLVATIKENMVSIKSNH